MAVETLTTLDAHAHLTPTRTFPCGDTTTASTAAWRAFYPLRVPGTQGCSPSARRLPTPHY